MSDALHAETDPETTPPESAAAPERPDPRRLCFPEVLPSLEKMILAVDEDLKRFTHRRWNVARSLPDRNVTEDLLALAHEFVAAEYELDYWRALQVECFDGNMPNGVKLAAAAADRAAKRYDRVGVRIERVRAREEKIVADAANKAFILERDRLRAAEASRVRAEKYARRERERIEDREERKRRDAERAARKAPDRRHSAPAEVDTVLDCDADTVLEIENPVAASSSAPVAASSSASCDVATAIISEPSTSSFAAVVLSAASPSTPAFSPKSLPSRRERRRLKKHRSGAPRSHSPV